jgi:hypothetical protein
MIDEAGQNIGAHFRYFERTQDVMPPVSVPRIQQQLAAGQQWTSIEQRLQAIEANISSWGKSGPAVKNVGITERVRKDGLKAARVAAAIFREPCRRRIIPYGTLGKLRQDRADLFLFLGSFRAISGNIVSYSGQGIAADSAEAATTTAGAAIVAAAHVL